MNIYIVGCTTDYYQPEYETLGVFNTPLKAQKFYKKIEKKNGWVYPFSECMQGDNPDFFTKKLAVK